MLNYWTTVLAGLVSFTVLLAFIWKGLRKIERAIYHRGTAEAEAKTKSKEEESKFIAQQERICALEGIVDILIARLDQQDKFLVRWTQGEYEKSEEQEYYAGDDAYHIREDVPNLQKKAVQRYSKIRTNFTK